MQLSELNTKAREMHSKLVDLRQRSDEQETVVKSLTASLIDGPADSLPSELEKLKSLEIALNLATTEKNSLFKDYEKEVRSAMLHSISAHLDAAADESGSIFDEYAALRKACLIGESPAPGENFRRVLVSDLHLHYASEYLIYLFKKRLGVPDDGLYVSFADYTAD